MIFLALDALIDLFPMNSDVLRRIDSNPHLVALYAQNGHRDFVADHKGLADTSSQYQHNPAPSFLSFAATAIAALGTRKASLNCHQEYKNPKGNCYILLSE